MRSPALVALLFGSFACTSAPQAPVTGDPEVPRLLEVTGGIGTFRPNPAFHPITPPPATFAVRRQSLRAEGEIIVLDGADPGLVANDGMGNYGITDDNQVAIVQAVLAQYPDNFDTIQIYLSFLDNAHAGSAYYQGISNEVSGIGRMVFNGRGGWGLPDQGRLSGFSNMNTLEQFDGLSQAGRVRSPYHAVIAQELTHRWLFFFEFNNAAGRSKALLGRDEAHWSRLAQASGSVQDGNRWMEIDDHNFLMQGHDDNLAPLDLYGMGIYGPEQVPPFYYLTEATLDGMMLNGTSRIPDGARVMANKIEVKIDQIVQALGPRDPPKGTETPYYRAALVLVTAPGQGAAEIAPYVEAIQAVQRTFPETYKSWTHGAGAICTKTTALCPEPEIDLDAITLDDGGDDLIAPGEHTNASLKVRNLGLGTAENVQVTLRSLDGLVTVETGTVTAPPIAEGTAVALGMPFGLAVSPAVPCGSVIALEMLAVTREGPKFRRRVELIVGNRTLKADGLDEAPDWQVDPEEDDTATAGKWALDQPELVSALGVVTQPGADHSPGASKLAFLTGPRKGSTFATNDVDGGKTTLESPIFAIEGARAPKLVFHRWFVAEDFVAAGGPKPVTGAALSVLGSSDGGATWSELATYSDRTLGWTRTEILLSEKLSITDRMRFRFVVNDPTTTGTVEGGIDDLEIVDVLDGCVVRPSGDGGVGPVEESGCATTGSSAISLGALALLALVLRRRRAS